MSSDLIGYLLTYLGPPCSLDSSIASWCIGPCNVTFSLPYATLVEFSGGIISYGSCLYWWQKQSHDKEEICLYTSNLNTSQGKRCKHLLQRGSKSPKLYYVVPQHRTLKIIFTCITLSFFFSYILLYTLLHCQQIHIEESLWESPAQQDQSIFRTKLICCFVTCTN